MHNRLWMTAFVLLSFSCGRPPENQISLGALEAVGLPEVRGFISNIGFDSLGGLSPEISFQRISDGMVKVGLTYEVPKTFRQDNWQVTIRPAFAPTFHWQPHLTPGDENIIAQHVFRCPALIVADDKKQLTIIPDLALIRNDGVTWYMDLDAPRNILTLGISKYKVPRHVLFTRDTGMAVPSGKFEFGFYVLTDTAKSNLGDPWRKPLAFLWEKFGKKLFDEGQPIKGDLEPYVKHTYHWAFDSWGKSVWQEFSLKGRKVGAPVFIVNVTQSPNYPGEVNEREFRSIWNQTWFSSLRSAQGLYRHARRTGDKGMLEKANMTKELALAFLQTDGLFPAVIGTEMEEKEINGKKLRRSKGWNTYYFGNSNRNPVLAWGSAKDAPYHILDMSWTAHLMLTWYQELEKDERLIAYATRYADKLITLQDTSGFFPAWLDAKTLQPLPFLTRSPETSLSATFLLKMFELTRMNRYRVAAEKAIAAVMKNTIAESQWEDYETYWSCSRILDSLQSRKVVRNNAYKQNTLSMFWTAEALLNFYELTRDEKYLRAGQRVLDEMLMYQASWQPPFIAIHALGGFGVMNADGEWNDSRQSLFAELIIRYGKTLGIPEYTERGIAALRASFVMMYCPENPETRAQWEKVYPYFNEKDFGFMMENYGHGGETNAEGLGIGEFTIYDWGNGAAAEAYNKIRDHFGIEILR